MRARRFGISTVVLALATLPAVGHDFWILPSAFHCPPEKLMRVALRVGEDLQGEPVPRDPPLIERFIIVGPDGEKPVVGRPGEDPAGFARPEKPGAYIIGYRSKPSHVTLAPAKFESYLREEGLEYVIQQRAAAGTSGLPGREAFSRCAKSLLRAGELSSDPNFDRRLGFRLELIAENDPYLMQPGQELSIRLMFEDKPLANTVVEALHRDADDSGAAATESGAAAKSVSARARGDLTTVSARTDAEGRARLKLDRPGMWLIKAVHMVPAVGDSDADWESLWASLTFKLPASPPRSAMDTGSSNK